MQLIKLNIVPIISMSVLLWLPISGSGAALGTRQRTITPVALSLETPLIYPDALRHRVWNSTSTH
jgi:hypothetical protein